MQRHVIFDGNFQHHYKQAFVEAVNRPDRLKILGATSVYGRVSSFDSCETMRSIFSSCGANAVPVIPGCTRPFLPAYHQKQYVQPSNEGHGVDFLIETLLAATQKITLVGLGPLTNIALALIHEPRIRRYIEEIVIVGGALIEGDVTPAAEYNFYADAHAAAVILSSRVRLVLLTHDLMKGKILCQKAACGVIYLLDPARLSGHRLVHVEVETGSGPLLGRTVIDWWGKLHTLPNVHVFERANLEGY